MALRSQNFERLCYKVHRTLLVGKCPWCGKEFFDPLKAVRPRDDVPFRDYQRPTGRPSVLVKWLCRLFRPLVRCYRKRHRRLMEQRAQSFLQEIAACKTRSDIEQKIGLPDYALRQDKYHDEIYYSHGFIITLRFRAKQLHELWGSVMLTPWDFAANTYSGGTGFVLTLSR